MDLAPRSGPAGSSRLNKTAKPKLLSTITFTNLNSGKTLWTPTTALTRITYDSAGHITAFTRSGVTWRIVVPGHGSVIADVGQVGWRIQYDRNGNIVSSKPITSGQRDGFSVSKLCPYLD